MKTRVLIIEPSEVIVEGLTSLLSAQTRFKVLPPLSSLDGLPERLVTGKPDVIVLNPTLANQPAQLLGEEVIPVVALVYQYVEPLVLKRYDGVIDIRDSRGVIGEMLTHVAHSPRDTASTSASYELSRRIGTSGSRHDQQGDCRPVERVGSHGHLAPQEHHAQDRHQECGRPHGLCYPAQPDR